MTNLTTQLRHAITPPTFDRGKLHRERLVDLLHRYIPNRLVAVVAPAGYGKTTLLTDFTVNTDLPVCWVRLSRADRDPTRLAALVAASLQKRFRRLKGKIDLGGLGGAPPEALARALIEPIAERVPEPLVMALDDIQVINPSAPAMALLDAFIAEMPDRVTVLIAGRELPEISMARLVLDGEMAGIGAHELALTRPELIEVLHAQGQADAAEEEIDHLLERTEGWPAGVWLSSSLLRSRSATGLAQDRPMVYEYLASEVLQDLPEHLRAFALEASILPVMSADMCNRVLLRGDSQKLLAALARQGLFITATDEEPRTFEFHPQFREFLVDTLGGLDPTRLSDLRAQAAALFEQEGAVEAAIELYFEADKFERAANLIDRHAPDLYEQGRVETLADWQERLKAEGTPSVKVSLYLATAYTDRGDLETAEEELAYAFGELLADPSPKSREQLARAESVRAFIALHRGDYELVHEAAERAEALLPEEGHILRRATCLRLRALAIFRAAGDMQEAIKLQQGAIDLIEQTQDEFTLASFLLDLYMMQSGVGAHPVAQMTLSRADQLLDKNKPPLQTAICKNNMAMDAYLTGRYEEALQLFNSGLRFAHQAATQRFEANILFGQADLFNDLGLAYQAADLYGRGLRMANSLRNRALIQYGCLQTSVAHRRAGTNDVAREWLERALETVNGALPPASLEIQRASLEISNSPERVQKILIELWEETSSSLRASEHALLFYFLAKSTVASGYQKDGEEYFRKALDQAGKSHSEQYLAGEMLRDEEMTAYALERFPKNPTLAVILERIVIMRALAGRYQHSTEETQSAYELWIRSLGESNLVFEGKRITDVEPLPRQILFFLLDHETVQRDLLLEAFWPDTPTGRQVSSLYTALHALRAGLPRDVIVIDSSVYQLHPALEIHYDVAAFEDCADLAESLPPGDPRHFFALTEAISGYGGPFLPEFTTDWVLERRRALEKRYLDLLGDHAQEALTLGKNLEALESLRKALELDPLRDDLNKQYLEVLGLLDRRSDVVAHYRRYTRLLDRELGLPPSRDVRELYDTLIQ